MALIKLSKALICRRRRHSWQENGMNISFATSQISPQGFNSNQFIHFFRLATVRLSCICSASSLSLSSLSFVFGFVMCALNSFGFGLFVFFSSSSSSSSSVYWRYVDRLSCIFLVEWAWYRRTVLVLAVCPASTGGTGSSIGGIIRICVTRRQIQPIDTKNVCGLYYTYIILLMKYTLTVILWQRIDSMWLSTRRECCECERQIF